MRFTGIALWLGIGLFIHVLAPFPAQAQKIIHIDSIAAPVKTGQVRVHSFARRRSVRLAHRKFHGKHRLPRVRYTAFALPDQTLYPPFYQAPRAWRERPDMGSRIKGGKTVEQGSPYRSHIAGGRTVEGGSQYRSHMTGGPTVEGGSRWASRIAPGRSIEGGSRWASTMPNWRFSGYTAPMRPRGLSYSRGSARWGSRLR